jgi:hypothetical protein
MNSAERFAVQHFQQLFFIFEKNGFDKKRLYKKAHKFLKSIDFSEVSTFHPLHALQSFACSHGILGPLGEPVLQHGIKHAMLQNGSPA